MCLASSADFIYSRSVKRLLPVFGSPSGLVLSFSLLILLFQRTGRKSKQNKGYVASPISLVERTVLLDLRLAKCRVLLVPE